HLHGRVAVAGVDEALLLTGEGALGRTGRVVDVAGGQEQSLGGRGEFGAVDAAAHPHGGGADVIGQWLVHRSSSRVCGSRPRSDSQVYGFQVRHPAPRSTPPHAVPRTRIRRRVPAPTVPGPPVTTAATAGPRRATRWPRAGPRRRCDPRSRRARCSSGPGRRRWRPGPRTPNVRPSGTGRPAAGPRADAGC